jgi:hypothetical protein
MTLVSAIDFATLDYALVLPWALKKYKALYTGVWCATHTSIYWPNVHLRCKAVSARMVTGCSQKRECSIPVFSSLIKVVMAGGRIGRQFCQPLCKAGRYSYSAPNSLFSTDLERSQEDATFELLKFSFDSVPYILDTPWQKFSNFEA